MELAVKCIGEIRNNHGEVVGYHLQSSSGEVRDIEINVLKQAINSGILSVENLAFDSGALKIVSVRQGNSLYNWCESHGSRGAQLSSEWVGELESGAVISIDKISYASNKKAKWKCANGHEWYARVNSRTVSNANCPGCRRKTHFANNSFSHWCAVNGTRGKQLLSEWTGELINGANATIDDLTYASSREVKWKCANGHEWFAPPCRRTISNTNCPYCIERKVSADKSFHKWCLSNGERGKQLLSEWVGELETGEPVDIDNISYGSNKIVKWRCSNNHEWYTPLWRRTSNNSNCYYCKLEKMRKRQLPKVKI